MPPTLVIEAGRYGAELKIRDELGAVLHCGTKAEIDLVMLGATWALKRGVYDGAREREREHGIQTGTDFK